ncbi:hypothetical protein HBZS_123300 [Helicobacter bizzozeronii CCUG 35545]|nr:hypothetical protein HBZS_123300 [Helicobacter bizzozeronii CCUG 35545]
MKGCLSPICKSFLVADGEDGGVFRGSGDLAMSTDSFVVDPLFFGRGGYW